MAIVTPNEIEQAAWEGNLEQLGETFRGVGAHPRATIGEPAVWNAAALENETGKKWALPADARAYALVRLAFTLHVPENDRAQYREATLNAYLRPVRGVGTVVAHDLFPQRETAATTGKSKIALKPNFKFVEAIQFSPGEAGVEIDHHNVFPVIQAYGLGESNPYWKFENHSANPLVGCQSVYLVLAAPSDAAGVRLSIELTATVELRLGGLLRVRTPEEVRQNLTRVIK